MKSIIIVCSLGLLLAACRHMEPESTEAQIQQHIRGEWTLSGNSDARFSSKMLLAADGTVSFLRADGTQVSFGTWECQKRTLQLKPSAAIFEAARASKVEIDLWDYTFPVIYADAHELVMAPGMSVAGRLRFTR